MSQTKTSQSAFGKRVRAVVERIPRGQVLTYKQVAEKAGFPGAARAVGSLMKANYDAQIPCHRVVHTTGALGDYNRGGAAQKKTLLIQEGVAIVGDKVEWPTRGKQKRTP